MFKWIQQTYLNRFKFERKLDDDEWHYINTSNFRELADLLDISLENDYVNIAKYIMSLPGLLAYCGTHSLNNILTTALKFYDTEHEQIIYDLIDAKIGITAEQHPTISHAKSIISKGIALGAIDRLFDNGENVHMLYGDDTPILHFAAFAENNALEIVKILLKHSVDINQTDRSQCNVINKLIGGRNFVKGSYTPINNELLELLLSSGTNPTSVDVYGYNALHKAAENKKITKESLDILFKYYPTLAQDTGRCTNISYPALAPIEIAIRKGNEIVIQYLIDRAVQIEDIDMLATTYVIKPEIMRILCATNTMTGDIGVLLVDTARYALWHWKCKPEELLNNIKVIQILINYYKDHASWTEENAIALVDMRNNDKHTLLHLAVLAENVEAVKLLCDIGYDANVRGIHWHILCSFTCPLSLNELLTKTQIIQILVNAGSDPCEAFDNGWLYLIDDLSQDIARCPKKDGLNLEAFKTLLKTAELSHGLLDSLDEANPAHQKAAEGYFGKFAENVVEIIGSITEDSD